MDELIRSFNFNMSVTDTQRVEFYNKISEIRRADNTTLDVIKRSVEAIAAKLKVADFPPRNSEAIYTMTYAIKFVMDWDSDRKDNEKDAFNLFLTCLEAGPNSGHIELMSELRRYFKCLEINDARRFLAALKRPYVPLLHEKSREDYISATYDLLVMAVRDKIKWEKDTMKILGDDCAKLYIDLLQLVWKVPEDVSQIHSRLLGELERLVQYEKGYTMLVSDLSIVIQHLDIIENLITNKKQSSHRALECTKSAIGYTASIFREKPDSVKPIFIRTIKFMCFLLRQDAPELLSAASTLANSFWGIKDNKVWQDEADEASTILIKEFSEIAHKDTTKEFSDAIVTTFRSLLLTGFRNKSQATGFCKVLAKFIESGNPALGEYADTGLRDKAKYMNWKENKEGILEIAKAIENVTKKKFEGDGRGKASSYVRDVCDRFGEQLKVANMVLPINPIMIPLCVQAVQDPSDRLLTSIAQKMGAIVLWNLDVESFAKFLDGICKLVKADFEVFGLQDYEIHAVRAIVYCALPKAVEKVCDAELGFKVIDNVTALFQSACQMPMVDEVSGDTTVYQIIVMHLITFFMKSGDDVRCVAPLVDMVVEQISNNESDSIRSYATSIGLMSIKKHPDILAKVSPKLVDYFIQKEDIQVLMAITEGYPKNSPAVDGRMNDLMEKFETADDTQSTRVCLLQLFQKMVSNSPDVFTMDVVNKLSKRFDNLSSAGMLCMMYNALAVKKPLLIVAQMKAMEPALKIQDGIYTSTVTQCWATAALHDKKAAEIVLPRLISMISTSPSNQKVAILYSVKTIGLKYGLLAKYKDVFISLKSTPELTESCQSILDVIEGRSLAGLSEEVLDQKVEIKHVTERVTDTEVKVENIDGKVTSQGKDISQVKTGLSNVTGRVDRVEENIEEINVKVEEVDHKTMNNAPAWSRDISKLLNPPSEGRDWRLLAARLGYSNNDIRNWATQHDPTMAVLSEFYSTHNTREATHGVLKALQEMNRLDAAAIVEKALKEAENVVADEVVESGPLPVVFLSYQWGHQQQAKLLRQHLESAGYRCWMDLGQMGGGDKLYAKIDSGMRATKVVICCVTQEYAKSDNCNREVGLAVTLGKPIIPLLFENMSWPPPGAMGPIFGEYLFVRFFCRPKEVTGDNRFWPIPKFGELLFQIRYHAAPDITIVKKDYENWWQPKEEVIVIPQITNTKEASGKGTEQMSNPASSIDNNTSPQIFLSYQWDKQPQIQTLYRRLASLGYTCWLDINQMGGGDSLYDKIDRGVRGCQVVVSCVTPKYAMSANCRKEVSLADAIKKPIIPILLDEMAWPPEGPMGMIFTQALYIAFHKNPQAQTTWQGSEFNQLLEKINNFVPSVSHSGINKHNINTMTPAPEKTITNGFDKKASEQPKKQHTTSPISQSNAKTLQKVVQDSRSSAAPKSGAVTWDATEKARIDGRQSKPSKLPTRSNNGTIAEPNGRNNLWDDDGGQAPTRGPKVASKMTKPQRLTQPALARNWHS